MKIIKCSCSILFPYGFTNLPFWDVSQRLGHYDDPAPLASIGSPASTSTVRGCVPRRSVASQEKSLGDTQIWRNYHNGDDGGGDQ